MTLKDVRDNLSRMFAADRSLETTELNHILIEDINGKIHFDYMLKDDSDVVKDDEEDEYDYDDEEDSELEDDDDDDWWNT